MKIIRIIKFNLIKALFFFYSKCTKGVTKRTLGGQLVDLRYGRFGELRAIKIFPRKEMDYYQQMKRCFSECDLLIDVGANIGLYMMEFRGALGIEVIGYEPDDANFKLCMENISNYGGSGLTCVNQAVGSFEGKVIMDPSKSGSGSSFVDTSSYQLSGSPGSVEQTTLDNILAVRAGSGDVAVMIDVEGGEVELLEGWTRDSLNVKYIAIEIHQRALRKKGRDLAWVLQELYGRGFRCLWLRVPEPPRPQHWETHAIFQRI